MFGSQNQSGQVGSGRFAGAPVAKWLLILNIAIFFLDVFESSPQSLGRLTPYGLFSFGEHYYDGMVFRDTLASLELWRLIGFQFLHANIGHLFANMLGMFMFGGIVERALGSRRFLVYYLLCGVGGALFYALLASIGWLDPGILVGASAGIFGMIVALIVIAPDMRVMLIIPPIPMKMKTFGMVVLGIGVFTVLTSGNNAGGEAGHLGGALLGYVLMKYFMGYGGRKPWGRSALSRGSASRDYQPKIRPRTLVSLDSSEVDRILDKVSEHGLHSLTNEERAKLRALSEED